MLSERICMERLIKKSGGEAAYRNRRVARHSKASFHPKRVTSSLWPWSSFALDRLGLYRGVLC